MYKLYHESYFAGAKMDIQLQCPNSDVRQPNRHKKNYWNKIEYGIYTCSECGCKATMRTEFKEVKVETK